MLSVKSVNATLLAISKNESIRSKDSHLHIFSKN